MQVHASRATIVIDGRCRRCAASIWYVEGEWRCSMCGRPAQPTAPRAMEAPAPDAAPIRAFLTARCAPEPEGCLPVTELFGAYRAWCVQRGERRLGRPAFARALRALGFERGRTRRGRYWRGLRWLGALERPAARATSG